MRGDGTDRALGRLSAEVASCVDGPERVVLAFSGGLGSLVVAALLRKRCELRPVVAGFPRSADVEASTVAQDFLDYPVAVLRPTQRDAYLAARRVHETAPRLSLPEILSLVPLVLVRERHPSSRVVSGFGLTGRTVSLRQALTSLDVSSPGQRLRFPRTTRLPLIRMAEQLGLPESFVRAAPRTPSEGSGIGPSLRQMARRHGTSVAGLLASSYSRA